MNIQAPGKGKLKGLILRSQLLVLLQKKVGILSALVKMHKWIFQCKIVKFLGLHVVKTLFVYEYEILNILTDRGSG